VLRFRSGQSEDWQYIGLLEGYANICRAGHIGEMRAVHGSRKLLRGGCPRRASAGGLFYRSVAELWAFTVNCFSGVRENTPSGHKNFWAGRPSRFAAFAGLEMSGGGPPDQPDCPMACVPKLSVKTGERRPGGAFLGAQSRAGRKPYSFPASTNRGQPSSTIVHGGSSVYINFFAIGHMERQTAFRTGARGLRRRMWQKGAAHNH